MAISRYDNPAQQNVQNTYVPIPYAELYNSLAIKQKEYDFLKDTAGKADDEIMALEAPQFIRTSNDYSPEGIVENPQYQILNQYKQQFAQQKQELLNSGVDFTTPEGKQAIAQYVKAASQFKNQIGNQIQQDSLGIIEHNKNHDEYLKKGVSYSGNSYYADRNVDKFLNSGSGFQKTSLNPYQERTKIVQEALNPIKNQIMKVTDKNGFVTLKDRASGAEVATIQNGKTIWKGVSGDRVKAALEGIVGSELDEGLQREALSYMEFLKGKNSNEIYNDDGTVKKITYKTKDVNGKPVEITESADKYYYNKKYNELRNDLQNYAVNTFVSSDVTDTQNNKILPSDFQNIGSGTGSFGAIPTTVTGYANVNQNSSSTPAKDAHNSFAANFKKGPVVTHNYGGGEVVGGYEKVSYEDKVKDLKSSIISNISDPNLKKKAEVLFNDVSKNTTDKNIDSIINQFDNRWQNVEADKLVNFVPTKDTKKIEDAFTGFVRNTAAGSIITKPNGEEFKDFDPEKNYVFSGIVVGKEGVSFNMRNSDDPTDVFKVHNRSNVGANTVGVDRNNLKTIGQEGSVTSNTILSGLVQSLFGESGKGYKFKVVADPNYPNLSSVMLLDSNNRIIEEHIPEEVLDNITLQTVAVSMGSSGLGNTPIHKTK
jgi:hypothetical protein